MKRFILSLLSVIFILTLALSGCSSDPCAKGHNYGGWNVVTPATCTESGVRVRYCLNKDCEHKETQVINVLGHDYQSIGEREPNCYLEGCKEHKVCSRCDSLLYQDQPAERSDIFTPLTDHDIANGRSEVTVPPGRNTEGKKVHYCKHYEHCGYFEEEILPANSDEDNAPWTPPV